MAEDGARAEAEDRAGFCVEIANDILVPGFSFGLEAAPSTRSGGDRADGPADAGRRGGCRESAGPVTGVLVARLRSGGRRSASHPLSTRGTRREMLHSLSRCLAECAMALGVGAAICAPATSTGASARRGAGGDRDHPSCHAAAARG